MPDANRTTSASLGAVLLAATSFGTAMAITATGIAYLTSDSGDTWAWPPRSAESTWTLSSSQP